MDVDKHLGFYKHGNLPHLDVARAVQFITFNLVDAVPREQMYRNALGLGVRSGHAYALNDRQLDSGKGSCILSRPDIASVVKNSILRREQISYQTLAWVLMPNHVHILIKQLEGYPISRVLKQIKGSSTHEIRNITGTIEPVWQIGYFDRMIRDVLQLRRTIDYIHQNPVHARLVGSARDWPMSSYKMYDWQKLAESLMLPVEWLEETQADDKSATGLSRN
ncbi:transposase [bacterium]|nr:transposase [bacterium]